jgi:twinkle protein
MEKTTVTCALPQNIRTWLHQRLISDDVITAAQLGWTGKALAIPITDQHGQFAFFKFRRDPYDKDSSLPKYWAQTGARAALYGWKELADRNVVVICEGELDRLCLESHGIAAVTSTCGAGVFKQEWCKAFQEIADVYVCFDNDTAGQKGIRRVAKLIPRVKVIERSSAKVTLYL